MADSKKYNGGTWEHSLRKLATATDTFTTLPVDVYADGNNATVSLKGNTTQSGTPTPESPIMPQGCGERTENLYDYSTIVPGYTYNSNGQMILNPDEANRWRFAAVPLIEVESGATYLRTYNLSPWGNTINFYDSNKNFLERATPGSGMPVTVPSNCKFVSFVFQTANSDVKKYMFTRGSTVPSEFIPFGYKIPISSANTTTPVYLGEVQTTRKIKKYTFTGNETVFSCVPTTDGQNYCAAYKFADFGMTDIKDYDKLMSNIDYPIFISSHFVEKTNTDSPFNDIQPNQVGANTADNVSNNRYIIFCISGLTTAADYSAWFAQQYANGTPVEVYYILETPQTAAVNEPLMKVGDYVDSISGVSLPTTEGANSISVDTTVQPSEFTATWTGWHDATVKEWDGSQWQ